MQPVETGTASWIDELKRRRVFRVLVGYGVFTFAVLQIVEPVMHGLGLPEWVLSATVVGLGVGFPMALVLAWVFDLKGGRIETTGGAMPRPRLFAVLIAAGVALGAPGVAWYFLSHRAPPVAAAESPSIAVLPFADLSAAKDLDWMCDGIAEEILDALSGVTGLRVAARSSSFQFKGKAADVRDMARTLGVSTLLEGSVRKVGERMRVSARLVSKDGYELWSDKFDRGVQDAYAIQEEIARSVVAALQVRLPTEEANRLRRTGTNNAQAYEFYLRGRQYARSSGAQNFEMARQMFKRASALDPAYAQAHAGIADADALPLQWLLVPKDQEPALRAEAFAESEKAVRLAPDLAEAHVARGHILSLLGQPDEADKSFRRATELSPGLRDAWYYYGRFLYSAERYKDAEHAFAMAASRDADDYDSLVMLSMQRARMGDRDGWRAAVHDANKAAERVLRTRPDEVRALYMSGAELIALGEIAKGTERLEEAIKLRPEDYSVLYNAACGYATVDKDKALDLLDRAVATGRGYRRWIEHDPDLDPLRSHPRFQTIIARLPLDPRF